MSYKDTSRKLKKQGNNTCTKWEVQQRNRNYQNTIRNQKPEGYNGWLEEFNRGLQHPTQSSRRKTHNNKVKTLKSSVREAKKKQN